MLSWLYECFRDSCVMHNSRESIFFMSKKIEDGLDYCLFLKSGKFLMVSEDFAECYESIISGKDRSNYLSLIKSEDDHSITLIIPINEVVCVCHKRHFIQAL